MLSPYIFTGLEKNADLFEMLALRVPLASLDAHTHPGRFTAREALAHWADWEHIHLSRIEAALREDLVQVPDVDEGERARAERYREWGVEECVERFTAGRTLLVQRLRSLGPGETERRFVHPFFGSLTVGGYCGHILGHDAYHAEQLLGVVLAP
ncbi:MAG: DinB family protein [Fimbriimonadaceae bacterium]|nr:DinB family protein [Fimbriimonadaceae bacterium]